MAPSALACPGCGASRAAHERLCPSCHLPLVPGPLLDRGGAAIDRRQQTARKIRPALAEGELVRVAGGRNQAEAELIQGLLLEEGVPSLLRRSRGFDVPDFLAAGPRDVFVPQAGAQTARELLGASGLAGPTGAPEVSPLRLGAGLAAGVATVAAVVWLGVQLMA